MSKKDFGSPQKYLDQFKIVLDQPKDQAYLQPIFLKLDQCQPHENFWTARQSSQVVNWVKNKPWLAGNQIPFRGTRFGFV